MSAATDAAVSASISTPVCAVVSADATISTPSSRTCERRPPTCESGSGWQSGISSAVRFAAMIPASCAVVSASPFGRSRSRAAVSGAMRTTRARDGTAALRRLAADVDHLHRAALVHVRQLVHLAIPLRQREQRAALTPRRLELVRAVEHAGDARNASVASSSYGNHHGTGTRPASWSTNFGDVTS